MDTLLSAGPSGYWQIIGRSLRLYKRAISRVIILSLLLAVIVFLPRFLSILIGQDLFINVKLFSWQRLWMFVLELASLIFFIGIIWRTHCVMIGQHDKMMQDLNVGLHKVISVFIATIITAFIVVGVSACIIGFQVLLHEADILFNHHLIFIIITVLVSFLSVVAIFYCVTLFVFLVPLIAIENCNALVALKKSMSLGWNHGLRIFTVQATPWFVYLLITLFLRFALDINIHVYFTENHPHSILPSILHMLVFALFIPWVAAMLVVQLKDLEFRNKEMKQSKKRR